MVGYVRRTIELRFQASCDASSDLGGFAAEDDGDGHFQEDDSMRLERWGTEDHCGNKIVLDIVVVG